jgi:predicted HAD superfamily Cof-like phosphohydrolase
MSRNWVEDIHNMQTKYKTREWVWDNRDDVEKLKKFLEFRINFLEEELTETKKAFKEGDPEEIVDGLIDLCVVAIGTLDAYGVNPHEAWDRVLNANMAKEVGVKESRPNPLGVPDLVKPEGWEAPNHEGNHGLFLKNLFNGRIE